MRQGLMLVAAAGQCALVAGALGQASYLVNFDAAGATASGQFGPSGLIAQGWQFRNQSQPQGSGAWRQGNVSNDGFAPHEGAGYLVVNADIAGYEGTASGWAVLPRVPGQRAGDTATYFVRGYQYFRDNNNLELRYSPTGGTGTGSGAAGVGDFTQVLVTSHPVNWQWDRVSVAVPGTGRLAFRYIKPGAANDGQVCVDTLSITAAQVDPPVPAAGQTVHWTLAMSPLRVRSDITVSAGATLVIDPGVQVSINASTAVTVAGTLVAHGTAVQRVTLTGDNAPTRITAAGGIIDLDYVDNGVQTTGTAGEIRAAHTSFMGYGILSAACDFTMLSDCTYTANYGPQLYGQVRLDNLTSNKTIAVNTAFVAMSNVVIDGPGGSGELDGTGLLLTPGIQPALVSGLTVRNTTGAGIRVQASNALIAPGTIIQNTEAPVVLTSGGLLAGSVVPATGNRNNGYVGVGYMGAYTPRVPANMTRYDAVWANVGLPYVVQGASAANGSLTITPGVTCYMAPNAIISSGDFGDLRILGTPALPVSLLRLDPATEWSQLNYANRARISNAIIEGSRLGVVSYNNSTIDVVDSTLSHNGYAGLRGIRSRKSQYLANTVGVSNFGSTFASAEPQISQPGEPNAFIGNGVGVQETYLGCGSSIDATLNWWGSPTGPSGSTQNPGGTGDRIEGCTQAVPFLAQAPDFTDHLPVVSVLPFSHLDPNTRITLRWNASDDRGIVTQRIQWCAGSNAYEPSFQTLTEVGPGVREAEIVIPDPPFPLGSPESFIRVTAIDNAGQEGFDDFAAVVPDADHPASTVIQGAPARGAVLAPGATVPLSWASTTDDYYSGADVHLVLDNDDFDTVVAAGPLSGSPYSVVRMPVVSTDSARLAVRVYGTYHIQHWTYTEPFSIRLDPRLGDAPPAVTVTGPAAGASFAAGDVIPLAWTGSDDQGLRGFKVYASYDGGIGWQRIVDDLPGTARSYGVRSATGQGFGGVLFKVVAVDTRFQNTSSIVSVAITPGGGGPSCGTADFNGDGDVGTDADIEAFFACLAGSCCSTCWQLGADFNGDGDVGTDADIEAFFRVLAGNPC